jgi:hypothetical protein
MKRVWLALLLVSAALAGCSTDDGSDGTTASSVSTTTTNDDGLTDGAQDNIAPVVALVADRASALVGQPVNFTWTADDPDGDELSFTFDADGDGTEDTSGTWVADNGTYSPFNFSFSYDARGLFNATINVTDDDMSDEKSLVVEVLEAVDDAAENATGVAFPLVLEGELASPNENFYIVGAEVCDGWILPTAAGDCEWFELPPEAAGMPYKTSGDGDVDVQFRAACEPTGLPSEEDYGGGADGHDEGVVPSDAAGCIIVANFTDAGGFSVRIG